MTCDNCRMLWAMISQWRASAKPWSALRPGYRQLNAK
jgi:hypothetical protein